MVAHVWGPLGTLWVGENKLMRSGGHTWRLLGVPNVVMCVQNGPNLLNPATLYIFDLAIVANLE